VVPFSLFTRRLCGGQPTGPRSSDYNDYMDILKRLIWYNIRRILKVLPQRHQGTKNEYEFKLLSKREESIAKKIVDAAFTVHKVL
jgi:hypothetical protein